MPFMLYIHIRCLEIANLRNTVLVGSFHFQDMLDYKGLFNGTFIEFVA